MSTIAKFQKVGIVAAALLAAAGCKSSTAASEGKSGDQSMSADGGMGGSASGSMNQSGSSEHAASGSAGGTSGSMSADGGMSGSAGGASGSMNGGTASGSMNGGTASGSMNGGTASGGMNGNTASGGMNGGAASGSANGNTASGSMNGGTASGSMNGGTASGSASAGQGSMGASGSTGSMGSGSTTASGGTSGSGAAGSGAGSSASGSMTDGQLVAVLGAVNANEIAAGKWASKHAKDAKVKAYGAMMVKDHTAWDKAGKAAAKKDGVSAEDSDTATSMKSEGQDMMAAMGKMKGAEADKAYVDHMVEGHQKVLSMLDGASCKGEALKAFLEQAKAGVQKHLDKAKELQSSMGGAAK